MPIVASLPSSPSSDASISTNNVSNSEFLMYVSALAVFCGCGAAFIGYCKPSFGNAIFHNRASFDNGFFETFGSLLVVLAILMIAAASVGWCVMAAIAICRNVGRGAIVLRDVCQKALLSSAGRYVIARLAPFLNLFRADDMRRIALRTSSIAVVWTAFSFVQAIRLNCWMDDLRIRWMFILGLLIGSTATLLFGSVLLLRPCLRWVDNLE